MSAEVIDLDSEIEALLVEAGLPVSDLSSSSSLSLLGVRKDGRLLGVVGIEVHGVAGLLRSLVVAPEHRSSGLGSSLVSDAENWAKARGVTTLYLLTTTAGQFFARRGYQSIPRCETPASIAGTAQFTDLCPSSSIFMRKALAANIPLHPTR